MPSWKKVIISGSDAALNSLDVTGDLTVDTNTLYIDSADNRVGIGTTSPDYKLDVVGEVGIDSYIRHNNDTDTYFGFSNVDTFKIRTANSDRLYISSSGNVGIGTTSPDTPLDVSSESSTIASFRATGGVSNNKRLEISSGGDRTIIKSFVDTTDAAAELALSIGNSEAMRINSAGNVGIGTNSPSEKLDVNGNASISGSLTISQGGDFTMDGGFLDTGGGSVDTSGGDIDTSDGNINLGSGGLQGQIPGSTVNVDVITATVKNFVIDHPSEEKAGYKLRHSSLEGPEIGVYFRGKSTESIIDLPDYWKDLVDEDTITVNLTSFGSPCQHYIEDIRDNQVIVGCACGTPNYHFTVYGERKDVEKLVVEYKEEKYL
jgi:hypothetical protein